jgi:hypothetical protein
MRAHTRPLLVLALAIVTAAFGDATTSVDGKAASTAQLLSIARQLSDIAHQQKTKYPAGAVTQRIDAVVEQVTASEDLVRLALLCHAVLGCGAAEHASYDGVFDYAMWYCARLLSRRPGMEGELCPYSVTAFHRSRWRRFAHDARAYCRPEEAYRHAQSIRPNQAMQRTQDFVGGDRFYVRS